MGEHDDDPIDVARVFEKFRQGVREHVAADDIATHFDLGVAYFEMGMLDDAEEDFALVLKVDPTHAAAWAKLELIMRLTNPEGGGPIGRA
jgi:tetratricopeptide (TPR) repeat protein